MKTRTTADATAYDCGNGFTTHLRLKVYDGSTWYDFSSLIGRDFMLSAKYDFSLDTPVAACRA